MSQTKQKNRKHSEGKYKELADPTHAGRSSMPSFAGMGWDGMQGPDRGWCVTFAPGWGEHVGPCGAGGASAFPRGSGDARRCVKLCFYLNGAMNHDLVLSTGWQVYTRTEVTEVTETKGLQSRRLTSSLFVEEKKFIEGLKRGRRGPENNSLKDRK
eukprot:1152407-Pelagomonas_calceolata.AAC.1